MQMNNVMDVEDYKILKHKPIGQGAQGEMYECERKGPSQFPQLCAKIQKINEQNKISLKNEINIINELMQNKNQNILIVEKTFYYETQFIQIMEKCPSDLQKEIEQKHSINEEDVLEFLIQIMSGYKTFIDKLIIHRDIKPQNIFIDYRNGKNIYKIANFGKCEFVNLNNIQLAKVGTPAYVAPELYQQANKNDMAQLEIEIRNCRLPSQSDIFSIGIIVYQLLFGKHPCDDLFQKQGIQNFHEKLKSNQFSYPPVQLRNQELMDILRQMMKYYPSQRITFQQLYEKCQILGKKEIKPNVPQLPPQLQQKIPLNNQYQHNIQLKSLQNIPKQNHFPGNTAQNHDRSKSPFSNLGNNNLQQLNTEAYLVNQQPYQHQESKFNKFSPAPIAELQDDFISKGEKQLQNTKLHYQNIHKYLLMQKRQMIHLLQDNKSFVQDLNYAIDFFSNPNIISPQNFIENQVSKLRKHFPYNPEDDTEHYIAHQYSLYALITPGSKDGSNMNIKQKKEILKFWFKD